jgi:hypothetical protein
VLPPVHCLYVYVIYIYKYNYNNNNKVNLFYVQSDLMLQLYSYGVAGEDTMFD